MSWRISPLRWAALLLASPVAAPWLGIRWWRHRRSSKAVRLRNRQRIAGASRLELPALDHLEITVLVDQRTEEGFLGDPGVSYLLRTDRGSLLMDVGFGPERPTLAENAERLGLSLADADAVLITHLHTDHMGGAEARRAGRIQLPEPFARGVRRPAYVLPGCRADGLDVEPVREPREVTAGLASTGPLGLADFFGGVIEEQAVVGRLAGRGLVVLTGCGHPGLEVILGMARSLCPDPVHAVVGGLHLPVTASRTRRRGIERQRLYGTGKPPWRRLGERDLDRAVRILEAASPRRLLLSAHDTCDHGLERLASETSAETEVLRAGRTYRL
jgi:7,8-dihydropterin-6-yl-methyl-4-(beta-D-ribofuranosyl)aminobenzene 5'-phosphate synthase